MAPLKSSLQSLRPPVSVGGLIVRMKTNPKMGGKPIHRLSEVDREAKTAICANCGPVRIKVRADGGVRCKKKVNQETRAREKRARAMGRPPPPRRGEPWKQHRKAACDRCGFVAEDMCQLDADHIDGRDGEDPHRADNIQTLCANCHRLRTIRPDLFAIPPPCLDEDTSYYA